MPDINDEYERKLRRHIAITSRRIRQAYLDSIQEIAIQINRIQWNGQTFSVNQFPALKQKIDAVLNKMHASVYSTLVNGIKASWDLSNKKNDIIVDRRIANRRPNNRVKQILFDPNKGALDQFLKRQEKGLGLSDRVWNTLQPFRHELEAGLGVAITNGVSARKMAKDAVKYLNDPDKLFRRVRDEKGKLRLSQPAAAFNPGQGVYRSSFKNAMRLTRTENNMAYRTADHERWKNMPFVTGIEVKLSLSHPRYDICDQVKGVYPKDFKFVGWHPQCLCFAVPKLMSPEEYDKLEDAILAGEPLPDTSGSQVKNPPAGFAQYVSENKARIDGWKNTPYWIKDNTGFVEKALTKLSQAKLPVDFTKLDLSEYLGKVRANYTEVLPELIDEEKASIHGYTMNEYYTLNSYLRGQNVSQAKKEYFDNYRNLLNNALDAIKEKYKGIVYRGSNINSEWVDRYKAALKTGQRITHEFFTSTTLSPGAQFSGNARFIITSKNGRHIEMLSEYDNEKEVLFKAGTKFKVKKVVKGDDGIWYITLEE